MSAVIWNPINFAGRVVEFGMTDSEPCVLFYDNAILQWYGIILTEIVIQIIPLIALHADITIWNSVHALSQIVPFIFAYCSVFSVALCCSPSKVSRRSTFGRTCENNCSAPRAAWRLFIEIVLFVRWGEPEITKSREQTLRTIDERCDAKREDLAVFRNSSLIFLRERVSQQKCGRNMRNNSTKYSDGKK